MSAAIPNILTIAGSDPSGGAGVQGDLKTFAALRAYGCAAITALTAQNTRGIAEIFPVPGYFVTRQLELLFDDIEIHAVKIGMLANAEVVRSVVGVLQRYRPPYVVLDPVLRASVGGTLLDDEGMNLLRHELLPLTTIVTPNAMEAGVLLGVSAPATVTEARECAVRLTKLGAKSALVTGGHVDAGDQCIDVLCDNHAIQEFRVSRIPFGANHGTGCAHSAAIATLLGRGKTFAEACQKAQHFVADSIVSGNELRVGCGVGPVHALGVLWRGGLPHKAE